MVESPLKNPKIVIIKKCYQTIVLPIRYEFFLITRDYGIVIVQETLLKRKILEMIHFMEKSIDIRVVFCVALRLDRVRRRRVCKGMQMRSDAGWSGAVKGGD